MSSHHQHHGLRGTTEYNSWRAMIGRCYYHHDINYPRYGGRGITVCDRWRKSFTAFYEDMGPKLSPGYSIERKDNNGNYEPDNCCWATRKQQARNTSRTVFVDTPNGKQPLSDVAVDTGISPKTLASRLVNGTPLNQRLMEMNKRYHYGGQMLTSRQLSELSEISVGLIRSRLSQGMSVEDAVSKGVRKSPLYLFRGKERSILEIAKLAGCNHHTLWYHLHHNRTVLEALHVMGYSTE